MSGINPKQSLLELEIQLKEQTDLTKRLKAEIEQKKNLINTAHSLSKAVANNNIKAAIDLLNSMDNDTYDCYPIFGSECIHSADRIAAGLAQYEDPQSLLEKSWFKSLVSIPSMVAALEKAKSQAKTEAFKEISGNFSKIMAIKKTAHVFGSFITTCEYKGHVFNLEGIASGAFEAHFHPIQQDVNIYAVLVRTHFEDVEKPGSHLSSMTLCHSDVYGHYIALGDVGTDSSNGIQIYTLQESDSKTQHEILEKIRNSDKNFMLHTEYLQLIEQLKGDLVIKIPVLDQFHGYCGFKSGLELSYFSQSLFANMLDEANKTSDLNEKVLNEILEITKAEHIQSMNSMREKLGLQMLEELNQKNTLVELQPEFFQDLYMQAKRYKLSDKFTNTLTKYMEQHNISVVAPTELYKQYLLQACENPNMTEKQEKLLDLLVEKFQRLDNDYDANALLELHAMANEFFESGPKSEPELNQAHPVQNKYIINMYDQLVHEQNQAFAIKVLPKEIETATLHNPISVSKIVH